MLSECVGSPKLTLHLLLQSTSLFSILINISSTLLSIQSNTSTTLCTRLSSIKSRSLILILATSTIESFIQTTLCINVTLTTFESGRETRLLVNATSIDGEALALVLTRGKLVVGSLTGGESCREIG